MPDDSWNKLLTVTPFELVKVLLTAFIILMVNKVQLFSDKLSALLIALPLTSLLALTWIYVETKDTQVIASHAHGTFWFVLPTLPMFLVLPALLKSGWGYWPALGVCLTGTFGLYLLTLWLTRALDIKF